MLQIRKLLRLHLDQKFFDRYHREVAGVILVGLVGKPSAGKSTFFNAVTSVLTRDGREETSSVQAKVGAFPFTTIEPNVGFGFCSVPSLMLRNILTVSMSKNQNVMDELV